MPTLRRDGLPAAICLSFIAFSLHAQSPETFASEAFQAAEALRDQALRGTRAHDIAASLVTEIGPRFAGSEGDRAAVAWALTQMNELGLQNVRTQDVMVPRWVRGSIEVSIISPWPQSLVAAALGGSVGTSEEGIEADVVQVSSIEELKKLDRARAEGRIVFVNQRMRRTRDLSGYSEAVAARTESASVAGALGAVAVLVRSIGTDNNRLPHAGGMRYAPDGPRIPAAALANPDADMLERQLASGRAVTVRLRLTARELPPARSANVIGEVPGSDPQSGIVLLGAHLDSWDITPGAHDDAAGVAIVLEAARLARAAKPAPRRTLRVVLFANEEFGLSGAQAYAAKLTPAELAQHTIAMEADLGAGPVWRFDSNVAPATLPKLEPIAEALKPLGIERGPNTGRGGPDLGPLFRQGVPVFSLVHDATRYFDYHHTANDTLDKIDPKTLDRTVAAYAVAAYLAAMAEGDFGRLPVARQ